MLLFWADGTNAMAVAEEAYRLSGMEALPVIPPYTLAGFLLAEGGSGKRLLRMFNAVLGWMPGSLAVVSTVTTVFPSRSWFVNVECQVGSADACRALMDIYSAILVVVPLIIPMAAAYGIDPVHLAIVFLANMELGYLMPPMGENLFLASYRFNQPLGRIYLSTGPYLVIILIIVLLITYVPVLTTGPVLWFH